MFEEFYKNNYNKHLKIIQRILHNKEAAEDIVQEAYMKAWVALDTYDENRAGMATWFNRILYNTLHDSQRKFKQELKLIENSNLTRYEFGLNELITIMPILNTIKNKKHREVCAMHFGFGYNTREIADLIDVTQTNVTTIINRFRDRMKQDDGDC